MQDLTWATAGLVSVCCLLAPLLILIALQSNHQIGPLSSTAWYIIGGTLLLGAIVSMLCCTYCFIPLATEPFPTAAVPNDDDDDDKSIRMQEDLALY